MNLWHLTPDAPRHPERPCPGQAVELWIGTWPIETAQRVHVDCHVLGREGRHELHEVEASWHHNAGPNSYWCARLGPFADGDAVQYQIAGRRGLGPVTMAGGSFRVGRKIHLAMLWHQHQPSYLEYGGPRELYRFPWVRLHAVRDYYAMAALVAAYPAVHLTINLVPSLLAQLEGYCERGAVDRALRLTQKPAAQLSDDERDMVLSTFFDADWHNQIYVHPRYKELFERRATGGTFSAQDLVDLQMWFNLAWFAPEFLRGDVRLHDGTHMNLQRFVEQGRGFTGTDIGTMLDAQYAIMRNVVPLHRALQDTGQIEVSTTPFYHPILPLIHDTDVATIDRPRGVLPRRFRAPRDAQAQVDDAASFYAERFGGRPHGMWPAEGAVGQSVVRYFAAAGVRWIASDEDVLQRSGRWGYQTDDRNVLCQPYRAESDAGALSIFFRDRTLSDSIGFKYQAFVDQAQAARDFLAELKLRLADRVSDGGNRIATIILDGDNAWGAYRQAARPFLHALYQTLGEDAEIKTVTFSEYLDGNAARAVSAHPLEAHPKVYDLYHGSWIDEWGSAPGVDLGTWVGEDEENRAWELLGAAHASVEAANANPDSHPQAFAALYAAEGSDWFWWFGDDQESGYDDVFDDLFRGHLRAVYRGVDRPAPRSLGAHIVPHAVVWTFTRPVRSIQPRDRLIIRTNCPGILRWSTDGWQSVREAPLAKAGGAMAGVHSYSLNLGSLPEDAAAVEFTFTCTECGCSGDAPCCAGTRQRVVIAAEPVAPARRQTGERRAIRKRRQ